LYVKDSPSVNSVGAPLVPLNEKAELAESTKVTVLKVEVLHGLLIRMLNVRFDGLTVLEVPR